MTTPNLKDKAEIVESNDDSKSDRSDDSKADNTASDASERPAEFGGRGGLDPTRYGDWEKAGRCIDF
ncbi:MAG: DUF1674 domain-containing protein [Woeseiaceae bacterium]